MKPGRIANVFAVSLLVVCFAISLVRVIVIRLKESNPNVTQLRVATWYLQPGMPEAFEELAAEYSLLHPGVVVEQNLVHWQLYPMWLRTKLVGGNAPEIVMFPNDVRNEIITRYMHPLTEYVDWVNPYNVGTDLEGVPWRQTFVDGLSSRPAFVEDVMEYYSVPTMLSTSRFYYNVDLYRELFGDRQLPATADEFFQLCEDTLSYSQKSGNSIIPITASKDRATEIVAYFFEYMTQKLMERIDPDLDLVLSQRELAIAYKEGIWNLESADIQAGFELVERAGQYFQQGFMGMERNEAIYAFNRGRALMFMSGPYDARSITLDSFFELGVFDFPEPEINKPQYSPYVKGRPSEAGQPGGQNLGIVKHSRHIDQAVDFLMFLSSKSSMKRWIVDADRIAPVRNLEPNALVAGFAPYLDGHLRGFRISFSGYGIGLTRNAYLSNLYHLLNLKGQEDRAEGRDRFTKVLEAAFEDSLSQDMRADLNTSEKVVMKNDSVTAYYLVKPVSEQKDESIDTMRFHRFLELQNLQTASCYQLNQVLGDN
jgi:raffinose/stachyose/melibiose transport system substrate-binding protein